MSFGLRDLFQPRNTRSPGRACGGSPSSRRLRSRIARIRTVHSGAPRFRHPTWGLARTRIEAEAAQAGGEASRSQEPPRAVTSLQRSLAMASSGLESVMSRVGYPPTGAGLPRTFGRSGPSSSPAASGGLRFDDHHSRSRLDAHGGRPSRRSHVRPDLFFRDAQQS